jgi:hypothetical protein
MHKTIWTLLLIVSASNAYGLDDTGVIRGYHTTDDQWLNISTINPQEPYYNLYPFGIIIAPHTDIASQVPSGESIHNVDLTDGDFTGTNWSGLEIVGTDLSNTVWTGANISGTLFQWCDLSGADFSGQDWWSIGQAQLVGNHYDADNPPSWPAWVADSITPDMAGSGGGGNTPPPGTPEPSTITLGILAIIGLLAGRGRRKPLVF